MPRTLTSRFLFASLSLIAVTVTAGHAQTLPHATPYTDALKKKGLLGTTPEACAEAEAHLGQLLYVNVDGFSSSSSDAIDPAYVKMVKDLQVGGVLPHFNAANGLPDMHDSTVALQKASELPLMIGTDYLDMSETLRVGLGFHGGFMTNYSAASNTCKKQSAALEAFIQKAAGLNQALGPTVENTLQWKGMNAPAAQVAANASDVIDAYHDFGVMTTMKHFPYTPDNFNLHDKSEDTKIPADEVMKKLENFKLLAKKTDFAMTTHLFNSNIDPNDMATFSKKWISLLRNQVGFDGILITDAIFMFDKYPASVQQMESNWDPSDKTGVKDTHSIFAARAILAGHDMVFLEGTAADTYRIFQDLHRIACQTTDIGNSLRARIEESYTRIKTYKDKHQATLRNQPDVPEPLIDETLDTMNPSRPQPKLDANGGCIDQAKWQKWLKDVSKLGILNRAGVVRAPADPSVPDCTPTATTPGDANAIRILQPVMPAIHNF